MRVRKATDRRAVLSAGVSGAFLLLALAPGAAFGSTEAQTYVEDLTAVSANVSEPGQPVQVRILAWSSAEDRQRLVTALDPPSPPPPGPAPEPAEARGGRGRGGRGRGGRGGLGGRGARGAEPVDPVVAALEEAATVGYVWTEEVSGYAIRYAAREPWSDGGERIVLATQRRLGAYTTDWDPVDTDLGYTLIEIRLGANGRGEGKTSLTTDVVVDSATGSPALADYDGTRTVLQDVVRR